MTVLENYKSDRGHPMFSLSLTTQEEYPVNVTITTTMRDDYGKLGPLSESVLVRPEHLTTKQLFPEHYEITLSLPDDRNRGIHIKAEKDKNISVIATSEYSDFASMDAFLALPVSSTTPANRSQTYIAGMISSEDGFGVHIGVVAYADNTELQVTPTQNGTTIGTQTTPRGHTASIRLNKGESLLIAHSKDLSGTRVVSSHPIAFLTGSQCAKIPPGASDCDHLVEQVPPVEQWGSEFITAPLATRNSYDVFKIVASNNDTEVHFHCSEMINTSQIPHVLNASESTTFKVSSSASCYIRASEKVLLLQFSASQSVDGNTNADPFMAMVPSISHYSNSFILMTVSSQQTILDHYLNIYILSEYFQPGNIWLNACSLKDIGVPFERVMPDNGSTTPIAYVAQVNIISGLHTLTHTMKNAKMGVLVYGFGKGTSYGYPGGLDLGVWCVCVCVCVCVWCV